MAEKDEMHRCHGCAVGKLQRQRLSCDHPHKHAVCGCTCASAHPKITWKQVAHAHLSHPLAWDKTGRAVCVCVTRKQVATHALFKDINVGVSSEPLDPSSPSMEPYPNIWREKHTYKGSERVVEKDTTAKMWWG